MSKTFYAVAFGHSKGIYEKWADAKKQIDGFPQPVYKKFGTKEEAEKYCQDRKASSVSFVDEDSQAATFYAVARGKVAGIFDKYDDVKESISGFPQPLQKKFSSFAEAKAYYEKFANGLVDEPSAKKDKKSKSGKKGASSEEDDDEEEEAEVSSSSRKRTKPKDKKSEQNGEEGEPDKKSSSKKQKKK
uniref:ribonuclease H n=1 Tax=Ditylenchus dipsaci TaxID=166011 RepID=A0A915DJV3_9BILA